MPRDKIMMFLNLKTKSNLPSQESGISFLFSSTANPDFEAYRAYQKKNSISKVKTLRIKHIKRIKFSWFWLLFV
jgi:hypothetical protein